MRFTIRDLLLVTAIVALAVGWMVERWRLSSELNDLRKQNEHLRYWNGSYTGLLDDYESALKERGLMLSPEGKIVPRTLPTPSALFPHPKP